MEVLIIVDGKGKRFEVHKPIKCNDIDMQDWLFSELEQSTPKQGNKLKDLNLGTLNYICHLKNMK